MAAISRLSLTDFRSYPSTAVEPGPGFVLLYGDNGAGKTNLLEAVSLLAPGRGLRGAALSEMARKGASGSFAVAAKLGETDMGTGTQPSASTDSPPGNSTDSTDSTGRSLPRTMIRATPIKNSDCYQVIDGHHRVARAP